MGWPQAVITLIRVKKIVKITIIVNDLGRNWEMSRITDPERGSGTRDQVLLYRNDTPKPISKTPTKTQNILKS